MRLCLPIILFCGFAWVGALAQAQSPTPDDTKQLVAQNRTCELEIPSYWNPITDPTGRSVVSAGNVAMNEFLSVSEVSKSDFSGSLADFLKEATGEILPHIENSSQDQTVSCEIGGMPAEQVRITGTESRFKSVYTITVTEGKSRFYRILTFTRPSCEREANEVFTKVLATFKPIEPTL